MLFSSINQSSLETPQYKLVKKYKKFEIRDYEKMIVAYTNIEEQYRQSTYTGFRRIANYIFGGNNKNMEIAKKMFCEKNQSFLCVIFILQKLN